MSTPAPDPWSMLERAFAIPGMHRTLDARVTRTEEGVTIEATLDDRFESLPGRLHGGVVSCLLDTAATWAVIATTGSFYTTVDLRTDFLRPASLGSTRTVGEVLASGTSFARARASLFDAKGRCCAVAIGTFALIETRGTTP